MTRAVSDMAAGYWHDALYDPVGTLLDGVERRNIKEGEPGEPVKFKAYRGLPRLALAPPALTLAPAGAPHPALSTFLYYSYGVHRHDPEPGGWPYHRGAVHYLDQTLGSSSRGDQPGEHGHCQTSRGRGSAVSKHAPGYDRCDPGRPVRTFCTPSRRRLTPATWSSQYTKNRSGDGKPVTRLLVGEP